MWVFLLGLLRWRPVFVLSQYTNELGLSTLIGEFMLKGVATSDRELIRSIREASTFILGSLRLIILFMVANFLVLFALGILLVSHLRHFSHVILFCSVNCIEQNNTTWSVLSLLRIFFLQVLGTSSKARRGVRPVFGSLQ